ncbi:MAG TPA: hypothetical protein VKQ27_18610 [Acetobacteraceae bacterium]|nr:hypothetical protein [Acetobacteraceae bacterium]
MSISASRSASETYSDIDVGNVVRRVGADLRMIADSTGCWTPVMTANYVHDIEELAKGGYLKFVDVTLISNGVEIRATRFSVITNAGDAANQRPGDALWPKIPGATLRIILSHTPEYNQAAEKAMQLKLRANWVSSSADTSHGGLTQNGGRSYASNSFGMPRTDWK